MTVDLLPSLISATMTAALIYAAVKTFKALRRSLWSRPKAALVILPILLFAMVSCEMTAKRIRQSAGRR